VDRCALFVDAGYVLAEGAQAVHGTRHRDAVSWDYPGLLKLLTALAQDHSGLPVLRCYWYDAAAGGRRTSEQDELADLPGVKLRLGAQQPGRESGETGIPRDLRTLAGNRAVSDVILLTADEGLGAAIADVQDAGIRLAVMHIATGTGATIARALRQECDDVIEITAAHLRPFADLRAPGDAASRDDQPAAGGYQGDELAGGREARLAQPAGPASAMAAGSSPYRGPGAGYRRAEPALAGAGPGSPQDQRGRPDEIRGEAAPGGAAAGQPGGLPAAQGSGPQPPLPARGQASVPPQHQGSYGSNGYAGNGYSPSGGRAQDSGPVQQPAGPDTGGAPYGQDPGSAAATGLASSGLPDLARTEPGRTGPGRTEPGRTEPGRTEPGRPEPGRTEPGRGVAPDAGFPRNGLPSPTPPGYQQNGLGPQGHGGLPPSGLTPPGPHPYQQRDLPAGPSRTGPEPVSQPGVLPSDSQRSAGLPQPGDSGLPYPAPPFGAGQIPPGQTGGHMRPGASLPAQGSGRYDAPGPAPSFSAPVPDSVQAAHAEGFGFGEAVARDAPALWLEAVLARKPRMPSDLEARLLQGSALPVDSLLQDDVRHALRRGFWDALERSRR
jgi:hypothetical protein